MTDTVLAVIIAGAFNVVTVIVGRLLSHKEHKETAIDIKKIKAMMNGK